MPGDLPDYYTSLKEFYGLFQTGTPILTYHKIGPRPPRARLKGLYLPARLFVRQLTELSAAGFAANEYGQVLSRQTDGKPRIGLTFDDGFQNVLDHGIGPLARFGFRAIQFLVADLIGKTNEWEQNIGEARDTLMNASAVREWLAAGHTIGSHTLTHPQLTKIPPAQARAEIADSKKKLEDSFGVPIDHFCYPWGDWNPTVRDMVRDAGYRSACTTEFGVNTPAASPFELRRFTARHRTRSLKSLVRRVNSVFGK